MSAKELFPCGGGSNLISGTGMENQIFISRTPAAINFSSDSKRIVTLV